MSKVDSVLSGGILLGSMGPYVKSGNQALGDVISRLAGDIVESYETEDLIVALKLADVIDGKMMVSMLGRHLEERMLKRSK